MANVRLVRKKKADFPEKFAEVQRKFLPAAGFMVEGQAIDFAPVSPGGGTLKGSISSRVKGEQAIVGTNVEYAAYVEYGTRYMEAQPYLRKALDVKRKELSSLMIDTIREVFRGR